MKKEKCMGEVSVNFRDADGGDYAVSAQYDDVRSDGVIDAQERQRALAALREAIALGANDPMAQGYSLPEDATVRITEIKPADWCFFGHCFVDPVTVDETVSPPVDWRSSVTALFRPPEPNVTSLEGPPLTPEVVGRLPERTRAGRFLRAVASSNDVLELNRRLQDSLGEGEGIPGFFRLRERSDAELTEKESRGEGVRKDQVDQWAASDDPVRLPDPRDRRTYEGITRVLDRNQISRRSGHIALGQEFRGLRELIEDANNPAKNVDDPKTGIRGADGAPDRMDLIREVDAMAGSEDMKRTEALVYIAAYNNVFAWYQAAMEEINPAGGQD